MSTCVWVGYETDGDTCGGPECAFSTMEAAEKWKRAKSYRQFQRLVMDSEVPTITADEVLLDTDTLSERILKTVKNKQRTTTQRLFWVRQTAEWLKVPEAEVLTSVQLLQREGKVALRAEWRCAGCDQGWAGEYDEALRLFSKGGRCLNCREEFEEDDVYLDLTFTLVASQE